MKNKISLPDLDPTDLRMLALLQDDATLSSAALGEQLSLSVTPAWRRRKHLEELGVIRGYRANLDRRMLGYGVMAFVQVRFEGHANDAPDRFEALVKTLPEVLTCHKVTGEADYVLTVLARDLDDYGDFVEQVLRRQPGVAAIQSSLSLREVKYETRVPITNT